MIKINEDLCIGCGVCVFECPDGIEMVNGKAKLKNKKAKEIKKAIGVCPIGAISDTN